MSTTENVSARAKTILLIEDKLAQLPAILRSIQDILFIASKEGFPNAPQDGDTEIIVFHLLDKDEPDGSPFFQKIRRQAEEYLQDEESAPEFRYLYEPFRWEMKGYPQNCTECAEEVAMRIQKLCEGTAYSIILDVVLYDDKDKDIVIEEDPDVPILSKLLFNRFHERCIPYTHYETENNVFRGKWRDSVEPRTLPFERFVLTDSSIHNSFQRLIYRHLNIGG